MKKRILTILLLISPYLYVLIIIALGLKYDSLTSSDMLWIYLVLVVAVFIPNMIYAFVLVKHGENSNALLFWNMILKLCNIPIYITIFILGFFFALLPLGFVMIIPLAIFDYLLLLPSSMYGVSGLIQAHREKKITTATAVINGILHFFFCTDVISAIIMFSKIKATSKKQTC